MNTILKILEPIAIVTFLGSIILAVVGLFDEAIYIILVSMICIEYLTYHKKFKGGK